MKDDVSERNDNQLRSLVCPHCKQTSPVLQVQLHEFVRTQLLWMKCDLCGEAITKEQIDDSYREYGSSEL